MKNESIVYLVGFMGSGKTSVGTKLAELMGWRFIDLDKEIEAREGAAIRELFRREGESYFRSVEREELKRVSAGKKTVVALGGGAFCSSENQLIVKSTGASIWLDAPIEEMYARCSGGEDRPLFSTLQEMQQLLDRRRPYYLKANLRLDVAGLSVEEIARRIREKLD
jgi:shikimate kinase